jgi:signal transduction histidine kinase
MVAGETCLSPMAQRSITRIQKASHEMESLIEGFLLLAREDDFGHSEQPYWISEAVAEEVEKAKLLLNGKPVELTLEIAADFRIDVPYYVVSTVIGNLVRNACHYTDRGHIDICINAGRLEVRDTGIGMSPQQLERVFDLFYRGETTNAGGKGIGMSLVKRFCERFGWRIELTSTPGQGTLATLLIPEASYSELT